MIKYCIFSIFCFLPFLIWADELPQLGKAPLEKVIQGHDGRRKDPVVDRNG